MSEPSRCVMGKITKVPATAHTNHVLAWWDGVVVTPDMLETT